MNSTPSIHHKTADHHFKYESDSKSIASKPYQYSLIAMKLDQSNLQSFTTQV